MRRFLLIALLVIVAVTVALSFYQPPMRLMPTPLVFQKSGQAIFQASPGLRADNRIEIFYATNRLPVGPRNNRLYAVVPGRDLQLGVANLRIGTEETTWDKILALSTSNPPDRRPRLNLEGLTELGTVEEGPKLTPGVRAWLGLVDAALDRSPDKDIIIYVHGANSTVERAAGQAAQLRHFTGRNAVVLLFAWPTAENFLRYPRDVETAFGAAPQLATLVHTLAAHSKARRIDILTYSAGGTVGSEGLAQLGRDTAAGQPDPRLGEIYHAAPDADFRGFVDDLRDYAKIARRVTVAVNMGDITLRISQTVNRASRAGRPDIEELSPNAKRFLDEAIDRQGLEVLAIRPADIPDLSDRSHSFWYNDPWVSSDVLLTFLFHLSPEARGLEAGKSAEGRPVWAFPRDYPERLPAVLAALKSPAKPPAEAAAAPAPEPEPEPATAGTPPSR
jgi:esterase/lipase superfamily enzyme